MISDDKINTTPDYGITYLFHDCKLNCGVAFNDDERTSTDGSARFQFSQSFSPISQFI